MSDASQRNFGIAQRERSRRLAMAADDPFDMTSAQAANDTGWNTFFGALREKDEAASAAGLNFRADLSGLGRDGEGSMGGTPDWMRARMRGYEPGDNFSLSDANSAMASRFHREQAAEQDYQDQRRQGAINDAATGYLNQVQASTMAPPETDTVTKDGDKYTVRPRSTDPTQMLLDRVPLNMRPQVEAQIAAVKAQNSARQIAEGNYNLNVRKENAAEASNPLLGAGVTLKDANGAPLVGAAVLDRLAPAVRNQVQGVLDGKQALPTGTATKDPYWKAIIQLANQADPNFDAVNYNARAGVRKDFTSGPTSKNINAINTAIGHLSDFSDKVDALHNGDYNFLNAAKNKLTPGGSTRGVALNDFNTIKNGLTSELTRVWRQAGGTEQDIKDWASTIGDTKSPQELHGALATVGGMLESKLNALQEQYRQGMGTDKVSVVSDDARKYLDKLEGRGGAAKPPAAGAAVAMVAPDGRPLMVPADKVAELEAHGAKRRQ